MSSAAKTLLGISDRVRRVGTMLHDRYLLARLYSKIDCRGEEVSTLIREKLAGPQPVMISRFGSFELAALRQIELIAEGHRRWNPGDFRNLHTNAGFFPLTKIALERFYERYLQDMRLVDVLGSWSAPEVYFLEQTRRALRVPLSDLEPYYHREPWSAVLSGRRVLVIHPFEQSIRNQYERREQLFAHQQILPSFELKTLRAVQSMPGASHAYSSWFDALHDMEDRVSREEFEIAIIGCGAYGMPLAAHVKRLGKKAVHLGGATQVLFGIIGKSWESVPRVSALMNSSWVRPLAEESFPNQRSFEKDAYW